MKKILLIIIIIILLIIFFVPFTMGRVMSSEVKKHVTQMNYPGFLTTKLNSYHTGWFTSDATLTLTRRTPAILKMITGPDSDLPAYLNYTIKLHIYHGPVSLAKNLNNQKKLYWGQGVMVGSITLDPAQAAMVKNIQGLDKPIKIFIIYNMDGEFSIVLANQGLHYVNTKSDLVINIGAINTQLNLDKTMSHLDSSSIIDGVQLENKTIQTVVAPFTAKFNLHQTPQKLWLGSQTFTLPKILATYQNQSVLNLQNLSLKTNSTATANKLSNSIDANIAKMKVLNYDFSNLVLQLNTSNIDLNSVLQIRKFALQHDEATKDLPNQQIKSALVPMLLKMTSGMVVDLKTLQVESPLGFLQLIGHLQLPSNLPTNETSDKIIASFMQDSTLKAILTLPLPKQSQLNPAGLIMGPGPVMPKDSKPFDPVVSTAKMMILSAYQKGYLIKQANRLSATFTYQDGKLLLNGKPTPIPGVSQQTSNVASLQLEPTSTQTTTEQTNQTQQQPNKPMPQKAQQQQT